MPEQRHLARLFRNPCRNRTVSEPKFTGVWIPAQVFQSTELSNTAKLLYGVVAGLDGTDGCYASNAYLQASLNQSERAIQVVLKQLEDAGLVVREEINGKRIIRTVEGIALGGCKKLRGGMQKTAGEGCRKLHPYNKEDNKEDRDTKGKVAKVIKELDDIPWSSPLPFDSKDFQDAWKSWVDYRKQIKKPIKQATMEAQWKEFIKWGEQKSIIAIKFSIMNGWQGIFEPARSVGGNSKPLTAKDHDQF